MDAAREREEEEEEGRAFYRHENAVDANRPVEVETSRATTARRPRCSWRASTRAGHYKTI